MFYRYFGYLWTADIHIARLWSHFGWLWSGLAFILNHHHSFLGSTLVATACAYSCLCLYNFLGDCSDLTIYFWVQYIELVELLLEITFLYILLYYIGAFQHFLITFVLLSIVIVLCLFLSRERFSEWNRFQLEKWLVWRINWGCLIKSAICLYVLPLWAIDESL